MYVFKNYNGKSKVFCLGLQYVGSLVRQPGLRPIGLEDVSADLLAQCLLRH